MSGCAHMNPQDVCASCAPTKYAALREENARLTEKLARCVEALSGAIAEKDRELDGFRRNLGRNPLVMPDWLEPARAALMAAKGGE